ncbi:ATP-grasp domain-containing protein [Actinomadura rudentiformis]|uniref:ATP-grasp domain-containing protein n=1 Tax=Actinomadura rudentiformis TaxID=359158 RepID=A0A6H9YYW6_9ACTN|nr:ATP-grasp domain-containing protein [Actinomadura rudentiformis]KAB2347223.1 ATP-grasp domain-containing protein [Actinomadura rudentiformis]
MEPLNVFVLGLEEENVDTLLDVPYAAECRFHPLLGQEELLHGEIDIAALLDKAQRHLKGFDGNIDAIVGYWDFPVSIMVPILTSRFGLRGPDLEAVVKCEHKYWSRLEQQKVTDACPRFALVDLDHAERCPEGMRYPMWLKPVKSVDSELAFHVKDDAEFRDAVARIREGVDRMGKPFDHVLRTLDLPPEIAEAGGAACLAEEAMSGARAAVEGYVRDGDIKVYGILDSITYPGESSFLRHQYPSQLPPGTQRRLEDLSQRVIAQIGLNDSTFSIEYFCDPETGDVGLLEINPRHSQSHARLFDQVDGMANHHCMLSLALGRDPSLPYRKGPYALAAKWYLRRFEDGVVRGRATEEEIAQTEREIPGVNIHALVDVGQRLSEIPRAEDSYSHELAHISVAAGDETELREKYDRCVEALAFTFDDGDEDKAGRPTARQGG